MRVFSTPLHHNFRVSLGSCFRRCRPRLSHTLSAPKDVLLLCTPQEKKARQTIVSSETFRACPPKNKEKRFSTVVLFSSSELEPSTADVVLCQNYCSIGRVKCSPLNHTHTRTTLLFFDRCHSCYYPQRLTDDQVCRRPPPLQRGLPQPTPRLSLLNTVPRRPPNRVSNSAEKSRQSWHRPTLGFIERSPQQSRGEEVATARPPSPTKPVPYTPILVKHGFPPTPSRRKIAHLPIPHLARVVLSSLCVFARRALCDLLISTT